MADRPENDEERLIRHLEREVESIGETIFAHRVYFPPVEDSDEVANILSREIPRLVEVMESEITAIRVLIPTTPLSEFGILPEWFVREVVARHCQAFVHAIVNRGEIFRETEALKRAVGDSGAGYSALVFQVVSAFMSVLKENFIASIGGRGETDGILCTRESWLEAYADRVVRELSYPNGYVKARLERMSKRFGSEEGVRDIVEFLYGHAAVETVHERLLLRSVARMNVLSALEFLEHKDQGTLEAVLAAEGIDGDTVGECLRHSLDSAFRGWERASDPMVASQLLMYSKLDDMFCNKKPGTDDTKNIFYHRVLRIAEMARALATDSAGLSCSDFVELAFVFSGDFPIGRTKRANPFMIAGAEAFVRSVAGLASERLRTEKFI